MTTKNKLSFSYRGNPPNLCCCDSTWRRMPGGEQAIFFLTGGETEPQLGNFVGMVRSFDEGETWGALETVITNPGGGITLSEVVIQNGKITIYLQRHAGEFDCWHTMTIYSEDNGATWSEPVEFDPIPRRTMIRNLYQATWGEYYLPYQYYEPVNGAVDARIWGESHKNPWNGVLTASSPDGPWEDHPRLKGAVGWAEVNLVELRDGRLVMLARSDGLGVLLRTESTDRGRTWLPYTQTDIPNPGSKFRLFRLSDGRILLLHNPSSKVFFPNKTRGINLGRNPLALWVSDDDMQSWSHKQVITDFPGMLAYPDGEVDSEERYIHFAFDYNRHDVIYCKVEIPRP